MHASAAEAQSPHPRAPRAGMLSRVTEGREVTTREHVRYAIAGRACQQRGAKARVRERGGSLGVSALIATTVALALGATAWPTRAARGVSHAVTSPKAHVTPPFPRPFAAYTLGMLIMHHLQAWPWALAGAGIAAITLLLLFVSGRRLGVSGGLDAVCSYALRAPYFQLRGLLDARSFRAQFLLGLLLGGFLSAVLGGGFSPSWDMGIFDQFVGWGPMGKVAWMFVGGSFIGFGTRMAGGCTSGHGIFGISHFEGAGLVSTLAYMGAGMVTTNLIYRVVLGAF